MISFLARAALRQDATLDAFFLTPLMMSSRVSAALTLAFATDPVIRSLYPDYDIWRGQDFKYEYTEGHLAIDIINGGPALRNWVDDAGAEAGDQRR